MKTLNEFLAYASGYWSDIASVPRAITPGDQWDRAPADAFLLLRDVDARRQRSVLDFGCGEGRLAAELAPKFESYLGVDVTPICIERCQQLKIPNAEFRILTVMEELPVVDVVVAWTVLMHFPSWALWRWFKAVHSILSDDGMVAFQLNDSDETINHRYDMVPDAELWEGRAYPKELVVERLRECGFKVVCAAESAYDVWTVEKIK